MKSVRRSVALVTALLCASGLAHALEFKSVGSQPAPLFDAPTAKGRKVFIAPRGMPVEVVLTYGEWTKIRDASGDLSWIESKMLVPKRNVVVSTALAKIHAQAEDNAPMVFTADKGVLLELLDGGTAGWIRVRHRDGLTGFVKASEVWGE